MIASLIISNVCFFLMTLPNSIWSALILSVIYTISSMVSLTLWEMTKDRIERLENIISKERMIWHDIERSQ